MFLQDALPRVGSTKRKKNVPVKRQNHVLKEIRKYQQSTELLIRKTPFGRLVKEITIENHLNSDIRWQSSAVECLQVASEDYLVRFLAECNLLAHHAKCVTIMDKDVKLVKELRGSYRCGL